ncbi:hypothetical protein JAAARDRAFT_518996 [Jaapia argillacea MUCL 33604]|uniref:Uncharacterized protein n=1 Tax=Jaapia argillacea MUCL 33604 TaxID=933084 RepID=A0A067QDW0_9AGAM|nr:hypothetical protein JAAARDRAFT_518996 [Jaapia argillacea MUCL 33604]
MSLFRYLLSRRLCIAFLRIALFQGPSLSRRCSSLRSNKPIQFFPLVPLRRNLLTFLLHVTLSNVVHWKGSPQMEQCGLAYSDTGLSTENTRRSHERTCTN